MTYEVESIDWKKDKIITEWVSNSIEYHPNGEI